MLRDLAKSMYLCLVETRSRPGLLIADTYPSIPLLVKILSIQEINITGTHISTSLDLINISLLFSCFRSFLFERLKSSIVNASNTVLSPSLSHPSCLSLRVTITLNLLGSIPVKVFRLQLYIHVTINIYNTVML